MWKTDCMIGTSSPKLRGVTVNGPILRPKLQQLAQQMGYDDFSATEGWFIAGKFDMDWSGWVKYGASPKKQMGKQQMPGLKTMSPNYPCFTGLE